jgi:uncharacterized membrane protein
VKSHKKRSHIILFFIWLILGALLRFSNLGSKPPWADEWATLVFSLGNSFLTIPLERIITLDALMQPLQLRETIAIKDVIHNLLNESTHPPIYFVLTHLWLKLFSTQSGLVSVALARSLSVIFGVVGIPSIFLLASFVTDSLVCGQIATALMAFSPYGVYLAQETRHYTLAIVLIITSLACFFKVIKCLDQEKVIPHKIILFWIVINSLGVATHYFVILTLVTEILVLLGWLIRYLKNRVFSFKANSPWRSISIAILGTIASCSIWIWTWLHIPDNQLTDWTKHGSPLGSEFLEPLGRISGWIVTMIMLLPIESTPIWITVISVIIVLWALFWLLKSGFQYWKKTPENLLKQAIGKYVGFAVLLVLSFAYFGDRDLTLAARFQFFYFPGIIILVAAILTYCWQQSKTQKVSHLVIIILAIAFLGSLTVVNDYGYQKPDRPDLVTPVIREAQQKQPNVPILIATVHKTHEQTGEMMGIAWEWLRQIEPEITPPQFLLLHKTLHSNDEKEVTHNFRRQIANLSRPFNVWVVNFSVPTGLETQNCVADLDYKRRVAGYRYRLFHCL